MSNSGKRILPRTPSICVVCGRDFMALVEKLRKGRGKICSYKCNGEINNGKTYGGQNLFPIGVNNPQWIDGRYANQSKRVRVPRCKLDIATLKARCVERNRRWRKNNPKKYAVAQIVRDAKRKGRLTAQPCVICGADAQGHHEDYERPLDLVWLCPKHHMKRHKEIRSARAVSGMGDS